MIYGPSAAASPNSASACSWGVAWPVARRVTWACFLLCWGGCAWPCARACVRESPSGLGGAGPEPRNLRRRPPGSTDKSPAKVGANERQDVGVSLRVAGSAREAGNSSNCPVCPVCPECDPIYIRNKGPCEAADVVLVSVVVLVTVLLIGLLLTSLLRHSRRHNPSLASDRADAPAPEAAPRRRRFSGLFRRSISSIREADKTKGNLRKRDARRLEKQSGPAGDKPTDVETSHSREVVKWTSSSLVGDEISRTPTEGTARSGVAMTDGEASAEVAASSSRPSGVRADTTALYPVMGSSSAPNPFTRPLTRPLATMKASSMTVSAVRTTGPPEERSPPPESYPSTSGARIRFLVPMESERKKSSAITPQLPPRQGTQTFATIPSQEEVPRRRNMPLAQVTASSFGIPAAQRSPVPNADSGVVHVSPTLAPASKPTPIIIPITLEMPSAPAVPPHEQGKPPDPLK